jgi:hypothetical protein
LVKESWEKLKRVLTNIIGKKKIIEGRANEQI